MKKTEPLLSAFAANGSHRARHPASSETMTGETWRPRAHVYSAQIEKCAAYLRKSMEFPLREMNDTEMAELYLFLFPHTFSTNRTVFYIMNANGIWQECNEVAIDKNLSGKLLRLFKDIVVGMRVVERATKMPATTAKEDKVWMPAKKKQLPKNKQMPTTNEYMSTMNGRMGSNEEQESNENPKRAKNKTRQNRLVQRATRTVEQLSQVTFKKKIISELAAQTSKPDFLPTVYRLAASSNLIPFTNGVYDLDQRVFRKARPDEFVHLTTGFDFDSNKRDAAARNDIDVWYEDWQPKHDNRMYLLNCEVLMLLPTQAFKEIFLHVGKGDAGKTAWRNLMHLVFGDLCYTSNADYFCTKSYPRGPDSILVNAAGKRTWMSEEPSSHQRFEFGRVKELTGGGKEISTRELYGKQISFPFTATLCMGCNEEPDLGTVDSGFQNRLRKIPWTTTFVTGRDPAPGTCERRGNPSVRSDLTNTSSDRARRWRNEKMHLLIEHYHQHFKPNILDKGLQAIPTPPDVELASKDLLEAANPAKMFLEFCKTTPAAVSNMTYEVTGNPQDRVNVTVLLNDVKWYTSEHVPDIKSYTPSMLKTNMSVISGIEHRRTKDERMYTGILTRTSGGDS